MWGNMGERGFIGSQTGATGRGSRTDYVPEEEVNLQRGQKKPIGVKTSEVRGRIDSKRAPSVRFTEGDPVQRDDIEEFHGSEKQRP